MRVFLSFTLLWELLWECVQQLKVIKIHRVSRLQWHSNGPLKLASLSPYLVSGFWEVRNQSLHLALEDVVLLHLVHH